jgi:hypothetical protein
MEEGRWRSEEGRRQMSDVRGKMEEWGCYKLKSDNYSAKYSHIWEF